MITVSADCRPNQKLVFHVAASKSTAWVSMDTGGVVRVETSGPVAPKYERPEGMDAHSPKPKLAPMAWLNPLASVDMSNETGAANVTCDKVTGVCSGASMEPPEPPLTKPLASEPKYTKNVTAPEQPSAIERAVSGTENATKLLNQAINASNNTAGSPEAAATAAQQKLHQAMKVAAEAYQHAADASGTGGQISVTHTPQEAIPAQNPLGTQAEGNLPQSNTVHTPTTGLALQQEDLELDSEVVALIQTLVGANPGEALPQMAGSGVDPDVIKVSLAGIVYSTFDHHPYTKIPRPGALSAEAKAQFAAHSNGTFPSADQCQLPKVQSQNLVDQSGGIQSVIDHIATQISTLEEDKASAVVARQVQAYDDSISDLQNQTATKNSEKAQVESDERALKASEPACFQPALIAAAMAAMGVTIPDDVDPRQFMCTNWTGTDTPECCSGEADCSNNQLTALNSSLTVSVGLLTERRGVIEGAISAGTDPTGNGELLNTTNAELGTKQMNLLKVQAAEGRAKQEGKRR